MKKLLKNKKVLISILFVYLMVLLFLLIYNYYLYILILLFFTIIIIILGYKILFNISFINIDKLLKDWQYQKYKKKFAKDEIYSQIMNVSTFDKSNEFTHPSVLYFKNSFNGYKFWMVYTPYSNCRVELENPCIAVSNDGINFIPPKNVINPLLPIIDNSNKEYIEYYNDPNLIYVNDKLELWYRLTTESLDKTRYQQKIFRMISSDGISWSSPELIIDDLTNSKNLISISLLYRDNKYYLYYFNLDLKPTLITSINLKDWSQEKKISIKNYDGKYWHGEVKKINDNYKYLFVDNTYNLYICSSVDGKNFDNIKKVKIICKSKNYLYFKNVLYKSSVVEDDKYYYIYVPFRYDKIKLFKTNDITYHKWVTTVTKIKKDKFNKILEEAER